MLMGQLFDAFSIAKMVENVRRGGFQSKDSYILH